MALTLRDDKAKRYMKTRNEAAKLHTRLDEARAKLAHKQQELQSQFNNRMRKDIDALDDLRYDIEETRLQAQHILRREFRRIHRSDASHAEKERRIKKLVQAYEKQIHPDDRLAKLQKNAAMTQLQQMFGIQIGRSGLRIQNASR